MAIISSTSQPGIEGYGRMQETTTWSNDYDNNSVNATEKTWHSFTKRNEHWAKIEVGINAALFFIIVFGNATVVAVLWRRRKNLSRMHFFILNLCIADLTMAFFNTLPQMIWDITYKFLAPDFVCRFVKLLQLVPVYLSSYILVVTAIDRYIAICHPLVGLRGSYKGPMRIMVIMCWIIAFVCSSPQMSIFQLMDREKHPDKYWPDCRAGGFKYIPAGPRAYLTFFTLAVYIIPSFLLAVMYGLICLTVWKNMEKTYGKKHGSTSSNNNWEEDESDKVGRDHADNSLKLRKQTDMGKHPQPLQYRRHGGKVTQAKVKTIKMTLVIVSAYVMCWTPFFVTQMKSVWGKTPPESLTYTVVMLLSTLNSAINPWIYFAFSANAARDLEQVLCCCCPRFTGVSGQRSSSARPADDTSSRYISTNAGPRTVYSDLPDNGRRKIPTDAEQQATRTALLNSMAE